MAYATETKVPVAKTRAEIERLLEKHGTKNFMSMLALDRAVIIFELKERRIRFDLPLPKGSARGDEQRTRSLWRALLLCIKAKLESVESKIETFDEAFLAQTVMPDGKTVYEHTAPTIKQVYASGEMRPLLPPPATRGT
jgi:hypothetical protein